MVTPKISSKSIVYIQWVFIGQINPTQVIYNDTKKYIKKTYKKSNCKYFTRVMLKVVF